LGLEVFGVTKFWLIGAVVVTLLPGCGVSPHGLSAPILHAASMPASAPAPNVPAAPEPTLKSFTLPHFTRTDKGDQGDPVNVLVAASETTLKDIFASAGWAPADPITLANVAKMAMAGIEKDEQYPTAPMSALKLFDRHQDMSYEKNTVGIRSRDHLRVWKTPMQDKFGRPFWAIAATKDIGVKWIGLHPTHRIAPDVDTERDLVVSDFLSLGSVTLHYDLVAQQGGFQAKNGEGDPIHSDGEVVVLELVPPVQTASSGSR
jgi:hypothetical protein